MSLLMKALKKAEESQQGAPNRNEPSLHELAEELSLEPREQDAPPAKNTTPVGAQKSSRDATFEAANLFAAKTTRQDGSKRFLAALSAAALLFLLAGGGYVYLAINKPALLMASKPVTPPRASAPETPALPTKAVMPPASDAGASAIVIDEAQEQDRSAGAVASAAFIANKMPPRESSPVQESEIKVLHGTQPAVDANLAQGYQALQEGRLEAAQGAYKRMLQQEPRNVDALLGLAAVETRQNQTQEAGRLYLRALDIEPKNTFAQAGLLNLLGSADPAGSEAKLKRLLADQPSAFLYFALGNLYAATERWADAQLAYFQAHHLASTNPDYAFNLAVSLEHINQPRAALSYYQRALQLQGQGAAGAFERDAVEARIVHLKKQVD